MLVDQPLANFPQPGNASIVVPEQFALRGDLFERVGPAQRLVRAAEERGAELLDGFLQRFRLLPQGVRLAPQRGEFFRCFFIIHEGSPVKWIDVQAGSLSAQFNAAGWPLTQPGAQS